MWCEFELMYVFRLFQRGGVTSEAAFTLFSRGGCCWCGDLLNKYVSQRRRSWRAFFKCSMACSSSRLDVCFSAVTMTLLNLLPSGEFLSPALISSYELKRCCCFLIRFWRDFTWPRPTFWLLVWRASTLPWPKSTELDTFEMAAFTSFLIISMEGALVFETPLSFLLELTPSACSYFVEFYFYIFSIFFSTSSTII